LPGTYTITATFTDPVTSAVRTDSELAVAVSANQDTVVPTLEVQ
jgi:hypothetical protein